MNGKPSFGVVGGLGALAGADVFFKLVKALLLAGQAGLSDAILEQHPFPESLVAGALGASQTARKLYAFDMMRSFRERGMGTVLLPCFISHTCLEEFEAEVPVTVVNLMAAIRQHVDRHHATARRIGVLTSDYVRRAALFERRFRGTGCELVYPRPEVQRECLMPAIYGPSGIKSGQLKGAAVELLGRCCHDLMDLGVDIILPGFTEIPLVLDALGDPGVPVIDVNQVYVQYALETEATVASRACKVGVVGGVGPAATVNFLDKLVRNTPARTDQEHLKVVVEQNPQIPDRTAHLVADGPDPTIALYATCRKLEHADADLIAIPCNTAHAFVERIQPFLHIPIVNMLSETIRHIRTHHPEAEQAGLLATDGTIRSGIYQEVASRCGLRLVTPDEPSQRQVMEAIYGPAGVKSGFTTGVCREQLQQAMIHLVQDKGVSVLILGCTELPLLVSEADTVQVAGRSVAVIDPTEILARACVALARRDRPLPLAGKGSEPQGPSGFAWDPGIVYPRVSPMLPLNPAPRPPFRPTGD